MLINRGIIFALLAALVFSMMNAMAKSLSHQIPTLEIVFFRSLFSTLFLLPYMLTQKESFKIKRPSILLLRGTLGAIGLITYFYTIKMIKLGDASIIINTMPLFIVIIAGIFLKERVLKIFPLLFFISLIGSLLVIKPSHSGVNTIPALVCLLSAVTSAGAYVCVRSLSKDHNSQLIVLTFMVISIVVSLPFTITDFVTPNSFQLITLIGIGITSTIAQSFITRAYKLEEAGTISLVGYIGVLFNSSWGFIFWGEILDLYSIIGGALIITSCVILTTKFKVVPR